MPVDISVLKDLVVAAIGAELEIHSNLYPYLDEDYRGYIREDLEICRLGDFAVINAPWTFGGVLVMQEPVPEDDTQNIGFKNTMSIKQAAISLIATANDWRSPRV